jgi:putative membrane protein
MQQFYSFAYMKNMGSNITLFLKGMAMGVAEVIPGVSGGTIAFITGIYEKLLHTIKVILGPGWVRAYRRGGLRGAWEEINGMFLVFLLAGMASGVIAGVFGVTHLLERYPQLLWAFFFGLIVASAIYIGRQIPHWRAAEIAALIAGALIAFLITVASPAQGLEALWFIFISGAIAISALILPGISGSFILLLMGMYTVIIPTVKNALQTFETGSLIVLATFAAGCLVGMATFSRVLSWTFKHYHYPTLALLTGFMLGSLNKIWPWRNVIETRLNSRGEEVPFIEKSVLPGTFDGEPMILGVIILAIVGFASVFVIERIGIRGARSGGSSSSSNSSSSSDQGGVPYRT